MIKVSRSQGGILEQTKRFQRIRATKAEIGWKDEFNASKAFINERGGVSSGGQPLPPRPFIKPAITEVESTGKGDGFASALGEGLIEEAFKRAGIVIKEAIERKIDEIKDPPLSEKTMAIREERGESHYIAGIEKPLIETGGMRYGITVNVNEGNKK